MINTICLCGSTRFAEMFSEANVQMTKRGYSVMTISMADQSGEAKDKPLKELLDLVHFNKIMRSDAVVIVGDGYIGFSTAREILWARMQGKPIFSPISANHMSYDVLEEKLRVPEIGDETSHWYRIAVTVLREAAT